MQQVQGSEGDDRIPQRPRLGQANLQCLPDQEDGAGQGKSCGAISMSSLASSSSKCSSVQACTHGRMEDWFALEAESWGTIAATLGIPAGSEANKYASTTKMMHRALKGRRPALNSHAAQRGGRRLALGSSI